MSPSVFSARWWNRPWSCLMHLDGPSLNLGAIQVLDRFFRFRLTAHFDKTKALWQIGYLVDHHGD